MCRKDQAGEFVVRHKLLNSSIINAALSPLSDAVFTHQTVDLFQNSGLHVNVSKKLKIDSGGLFAARARGLAVIFWQYSARHAEPYRSVLDGGRHSW
jgi:hypothetical protein